MFQKCYMVMYVVILLSVVSSVSGQNIGLQFGSTFVNEKLIFKESNNNYRPFTFVGLNYQNKGITTYVTYTFNLKVVTLGSSIQIYKIRNKRIMNKY